MQKIGVMFVCLGNICRSPLAEAIFADQVQRHGLDHRFDIASSGTANYHVGEQPDPRTIDVARRNSVPIDHHGQQLDQVHFHEYDYIITMDRSNLTNAERIAPQEHSATMVMMRDFDPSEPGSDVVDPWYGDRQGFDECFDVLERSCANFLEHLKSEHSL